MIVLLRVTSFLLVVALDGPSESFVLDEVGHSHVSVATANFGATVKDERVT